MQLVKTFPILYKKESRGGIQIWEARVYSNETMAVCSIRFGLLDGHHQNVDREYHKGKNIGKKNATTPLTQCIQETEKRWNDKQRKENYSTTLEQSIVSTVYPMLAQKFNPLKAVFPCFGQPKLDGVRCIVYQRDDHVVFQSRTGTPFLTMEHLRNRLTILFRNYPHLILDGELYTSSMPFEEFVGLVKKQNLVSDDQSRLHQIRFHVFDIINNDTFNKRFAWMNENISEMIVPTFMMHSMTDFRTKFQECIEQGYEGIMVRSITGLYKRNYRSKDLLKYKEFVEDEFLITGFKEGEGREKGSVIWICQNKTGKGFAVRPRGSLEHRRALYKDADKYIGKYLTVIYQELTEQDVPRFPVGKAVRDAY